MYYFYAMVWYGMCTVYILMVQMHGLLETGTEGMNT